MSKLLFHVKHVVSVRFGATVGGPCPVSHAVSYSDEYFSFCVGVNDRRRVGYQDSRE